MRKALLFLIAIMATMSIFADEWQKPIYSGNYQPLTTGTTFYIYNTESQLFFTEGNDYGTHASVGNTGLKCVVEQYVEDGAEWDNASYTILVSSIKNKSDDYLFITSSGHMYVDCKDRGNNQFYIKPLSNNTFQIAASNFSTDWNATICPGYLMGHDPNYVNSDDATVTGTGVIYDDPTEMGEGFHTTWAFVSEADYATYLEVIDVYETAMKLKAAIEHAEEEGVTGLDDEKTVYANTSSTKEALEGAIESVSAKLLKYYEESVTPDAPKVIVTDKCNSIESWTNGINASTWNTQDWIDEAWTGFDGTTLNIWGASMNGKAYKALAELPNGIYVVSMATYSQSLDGYVFANRNRKAVGAGAAGNVYEVTTNVTDGTLEYGFGQDIEGTNWVPLDNVTVKYYGSGTDAFKYWLNSLKESAPNFDDATVQDSLVTEYEKVLQTVDNATTDDDILAAIPQVEDILNKLELNIAAYLALSEVVSQADLLGIDDDINTYYGNILSDESSAKSEILEDHKLGTDAVQSITEELQEIVDEAQNYIWQIQKLAEEMAKAVNIYEEYKDACTPEAKAAYETYADDYDTLDKSQLKASDVIALLEQLYAIEFNLTVPAEKASDDNPVDYTAKVQYPSFDGGSEGWINDGWSTCGTNSWNSFADGYVIDKLYLNLWNESNARVYQTLTNLPAGTYILQISAFADAEGLQVYANNDFRDVMVGQNNEEGSAFYGVARSFGETTEVFTAITDEEAEITPTVWYGNVYLITTTVGEDGTMEIGARNVSGSAIWGMIDNVKLTYYGTESAKVPTSTGIEATNSNDIKVVKAIYNGAGVQNATLQKGINIVKYNDGTTQKIFFK